MAGVSLRHIYKKYGNITAVSDVNIEVQDREFLVLVGPSGCGKTTTLRMVAGLEEISSGEIQIGDRIVNDVPPKDRDIAMVFQSYALYPHMSVYDNLAFGLKLRKTPKPEISQRVRTAAETLGISNLLDRKPKQLSGGQRQRVALGRAIVREPKVFLMDEPLSNLDAKLRVQTRAELIKLHQRLQTTVVYVTHDQTEAMTMGTRIAVMKDGLLQQLDAPQQIYDNPANVFVAGFIGSPAMNFMDAQVQSVGDRMVVDTGTFRMSVPAQKAASLRAHQGQDVIVGIRPEDIYERSLVPPGHHAPEQGMDSTSVNVEVVEHMGSELYVYFDAGRFPIVSRLDPRTDVAAGRKIDVVFDSNKMHVFDRQSQLAL